MQTKNVYSSCIKIKPGDGRMKTVSATSIQELCVCRCNQHIWSVQNKNKHWLMRAHWYARRQNKFVTSTAMHRTRISDVDAAFDTYHRTNAHTLINHRQRRRSGIWLRDVKWIYTISQYSSTHNNDTMLHTGTTHDIINWDEPPERGKR